MKLVLSVQETKRSEDLPEKSLNHKDSNFIYIFKAGEEVARSKFHK